MRSRGVISTLAAALVLPMIGIAAPATVAAAAPPPVAAPAAASPGDEGVLRDLSDKSLTLDGMPVSTPKSYQGNAARALAAVDTPAVGTVRQWLADDDFNGILYRKDYTLRGVGANIEVWVANDIAFQPGDCRLALPSSTVITDDQVNSLITEFDTNMYPKETTTFSTPPDRDGTNALLGPDVNGNGGDYTGAGNRTVTLVDNVRDDNYYDFPANPTYIAGFFSSQFNELVDRNVMTIDAFDWLHRTGASPADEPTTDLCTSRPARPRLYEGTFAHEWQHLLQYYTDPSEVNWINEGLSDFAQTLVGYVDATKTVYQAGADSHIYCFQGFGIVATPFNTNPRDCGGPENSLTVWGEGDANAILADYGNAYSFMLFLYDRYGEAFMSALHRDGERQGIASLEAQLAAVGVTNTYRVIHDFQTSTLLDQLVDNRRTHVVGVRKSRITSASLNSTINLANPRINSEPGAAPNGADYVPLANKNGKLLRGNALRSVVFHGASVLDPTPLLWSVVSDDPDRPGNPVLWSGNESNLDAAAVTAVTVPTDDPTLRFVAKYGAELTYDYGYVTVSTDGGATYTAIPGNNTVDGPQGPGLNGTTAGFEAESYDLSAYAGQDILLGFRYISDGGVNEGGLLIDDVTLGATVISDGSTVDPFSSPTQISPVTVANWNVRINGINDRGRCSSVVVTEYSGKSDFSLSRHALRTLRGYQKVIVIVSYDEPTEQYRQYAPYTLAVNGVVQPGGAASSS